MERQTRPRLTPGKLGYRNVVPAAPKSTPFVRSQSEGTSHILPMNRLLQIVRHPVSVIGKLGEGLFLWNFWIHLALDFERKKSVCVVITDRSLTGSLPSCYREFEDLVVREPHCLHSVILLQGRSLVSCGRRPCRWEAYPECNFSAGFGHILWLGPDQVVAPPFLLAVSSPDVPQENDKHQHQRN
jgi:hypothetical protein